MQRNAFARVVDARRRPDFSVEPLAIAWDAVAFRIDGVRECIACVPRAELDDFLDQLESGALDDSIRTFLATPPSGRVLRAASQANSTGLFDTMAAPGAITPAERVPGRALPFGGGGGTPADVRREKQHRGRRLPSRAVLAAVIAAGVLIAGVAIAAAGGGGSGQKAAATTTTTARPVTTTTRATTTTKPTFTTTPDPIANALIGDWNVTRTIVASTNPDQPVGKVDHVKYTITSTCTRTPCTLHLVAPGFAGSVEEADLKPVGDHYEGDVTGTSPCPGHPGFGAITGTVSLTPVKGQVKKFTGELIVAIGHVDGCKDGRTGTLELEGQRTN